MSGAYAFPSLATNTESEVGVSLAWGGGSTSSFGSHAVGLMGDFRGRRTSAPLRHRSAQDPNLHEGVNRQIGHGSVGRGSSDFSTTD
jgi:hypothetical protein